MRNMPPAQSKWNWDQCNTERNKSKAKEILQSLTKLAVDICGCHQNPKQQPARYKKMIKNKPINSFISEIKTSLKLKIQGQKKK